MGREGGGSRTPSLLGLLRQAAPSGSEEVIPKV